MRVKINKFSDYTAQTCILGKAQWSVARLIQLTKDFDVMEIPLAHLNLYLKYDAMTLREMVGHMISVNEADLSYPIILDEDGEIMDGRHRIMKALLNGEKVIKAVRFEENPATDRYEESE